MKIFYKIRQLLIITTAIALAACQTVPNSPARDPAEALDFEVAINEISNSLVQQVNQPGADLLGQIRSQLKSAIAKQTPKQAVLDHIIDPFSGLHTSLADRLEQGLLRHLNAPNSGINAAALTSANLTQAELLITGAIGLDKSAGRTGHNTSPALAKVIVVDRKTGKVIARASALIRNDGFLLTPNRFEQDSPVILLDKTTKIKIATTQQLVGESVNQRYLAQLSSAALIDAGMAAYANKHYGIAADKFKSALSESSEELRALTGSYLSSVKLGLLDRAEEFFGKIISYGISERELSVKFLFQPGSTEFWQNTQVSGLYGMWVRQAARRVSSARACLELIGHASRTGTESFNDKLSDQRAQFIRDRMVQEVPTLASRISARGMGSREPIVGTGTDDAGDAEDRRVAFSFRECR